MPFMETSAGANIHYEDMGEGRPLVLIHGWSGSGTLWQFQKELADDYRLIIPDLRGHGRSTGGPEGFDLDALASDMVDIFETLDLTDAVMVGWSLGSQVTIKAFSRLSERLAGLVLVGGTARFTATEGYPHGQPANEMRGIALRLRRNYEKTLGEFFRSMFADHELDRKHRELVEHRVLAAGRLPDPAIARAALSVLADSDLREMLPEIDLPVLVVHGDKDAICPPGAGRYLAERIPGARLVEMAGAGHAPPLSRPEDFNTVLRDFLHKGSHAGH